MGQDSAKGIGRPAIVLALCLALFSTPVLYLAQTKHHETERLLAAQQTLLARQSAANLEKTLQSLQQGMGHIARRGAQLLHTPEQVESQLALLFRNDTRNLLTALYLRDTQGNILAEFPENGLAKSSFPVHLLADDPTFFTSPRILRAIDLPHLLLAEPIKSDNRTVAELGALISLSDLSATCLGVFGKEVELAFLLDDSGRLLLATDESLEGGHFPQALDAEGNPDLYRLLLAMSQGKSGSRRCPSLVDESLAPDYAEGDTLYAFAPLRIAGQRWSLALALPGGLLTTLRHGNNLLYVFGALCMALASLLAVHAWLWKRRTLRLNQENLAAKEESRRLGENFRAAEERSRQLLHNAGDAILFLDPDSGALREANRQAENLLGYTAAELRALSLSILFPGHQRRRYLRLVKRVMREGYGEEGALLFRRKSGQLFTGAVHARLGNLGSLQVVHVVLRDVSEVKRIEQELRQKNRDLSLLNEITHQVTESRNLQGILDTILSMVVDNFKGDGGGIYLDRDASHNLQLAAHRNIKPEVLADLDHIPPGIGLAGRAAASGQPRSSADIQKDRRVRSQAARKAGWRGFQAVPLSSREKTVGVLFLFRHRKHTWSREEVRLLLSIGRQVGASVEHAGLFEELQWQYRLTHAANRELESSRRQLKENVDQLADANRTLERLDQMKNNFLTLASHELRTPLTYVLSSTELLSEALADRLAHEEQRCLRAIHLGGKRLQEIVQDLTEATRLQTQRLYVGRERIDLTALVTTIQDDFRAIVDTRNLEFDIGQLPPSLTLHGDPDHLRRALSRLVENAIKFTPEGGRIEITSSRKTGAEIRALEEGLAPFSPTFFQGELRSDFLQLTVRDSGIGIDPEERVRIFDKFYEIGDISSHFTSQTRFGGKGVGLGLTLVKGLIEAHGGMVWVESAGVGDHSTGSAFHLLLPMARDVEETCRARG